MTELTKVELWRNKASLAADYALKKSNGHAMINLADVKSLLTSPGNELLDPRVLNLTLMTVSQLMETEKQIPNIGVGIMVVGFTNKLMTDPSAMSVLQKIRSFGNQGGRVLLLTDEQVDPGFFVTKKPWMNGPFPSDGMWSMHSLPNGIFLQQYELEYVNAISASPSSALWSIKKDSSKVFRI